MTEPSTLRARRPLRLALLATLSTLWLTICALVLVLVGLPTLFLARDLYRAVASSFSRGLLRLWGVRLEVEGAAWPAGQVVYVGNHVSALDVFVVAALGLPRARNFLSGWIKAIIPLWVVNAILGTFWTVDQDQPERRRAIFERAARTLARTGESVFLTPEGLRVRTGRIERFNKGAFHLALSLRAPIVPLFIHTPRDTDPGMGLDVRPGVVHVRVGEPIAPASAPGDQSLAAVEAYRDLVRERYLRWHATVGAGLGHLTDLADGAAEDSPPDSHRAP